jgi:hypothetical protein
VPPQPLNQRQRPSRNVLLAAGIVVGLILIGVLLVLLNLTSKPQASPAPSNVTHGSAAPTTAGSPRSSSVLSTPNASAVLPTFVPSPPGPPPSAGSAGAQLLAEIPDQIRPTCDLGQSSNAHIVASARCILDNGILVAYGSYDSVNSMNADFDQVVAAAQIDANSGDCEDHTTWPAESSYDVQGAPVGRRFCSDEPTGSAVAPTIFWTDERLNILSTASGPDAAGLVEFWTNEAGPVPTQ